MKLHIDVILIMEPHVNHQLNTLPQDVLSHICTMLPPPDYASLYCTSKEFLTYMDTLCKPANQVVTIDINFIHLMPSVCWANIHMKTTPTVDEIAVLSKCKVWKLDLRNTQVVDVSALGSVHILGH